MPLLQLSPPLDLSGRQIFITGGTGFVGRTLLDYLDESAKLANDDFEVVVMSRAPDDFLKKYPRYAGKRWLEFVEGEITTGFPKTSRQFTDVIHAAAETHNAGNSVVWIDQIVGGTKAALDFACSVGAKRFLLTSSGAVYGQQPAGLLRVPESYTGAPPTGLIQSSYGQAKRLAEQLCTSYRIERGLHTIVARCFAFVGEHIPLDGPYAIGNFIRDALHADRLLIKGDGTAVRSYLYGRDMAHWLMTMLLTADSGSCINVGSDQAISIHELACQVAQCLSPGKPVVLEKSIMDNKDRSIYVPEITQAAQLGLSIEVGLAEAISLVARRLQTADAI